MTKKFNSKETYTVVDLNALISRQGHKFLTAWMHFYIRYNGATCLCHLDNDMINIYIYRYDTLY